MTTTRYDDLALVPSMVARRVCETPYRAVELKPEWRSASVITQVETLRRAMTPNQVREFMRLCDARCRRAYESKTDWFLKCVQSERPDQLSAWLSHWLNAYLRNPRHFRKIASDPAV